MRFFFLFLATFITTTLFAQHIESGYFVQSDYNDSNGNKIGKGSMQYISGSYTLPLSIKRDAEGGMRMWSATVTGKYATLDNKEGALFFNPEEIINAGAMITHVCPLSKRWNLVATAGVSLNTALDYVRLQSLAVTSGMLFMYRVNKNLNIGVGVVGTTAYGELIVLPAPLITWKYGNRYKFELNMQGTPEFKISTQLNEKLKLTLTPFEMRRFSAMINVNNDHKVYVHNIFGSSIGASYRVTKHWSVEGRAGYIYYRSTRIQDRSFKAFWNDLFDYDTRRKYEPSGCLSLGIRYHMR